MTATEVVLVTGASSGIGLELAKQFANRGYDLVVVADDDIATAANDLASTGREIEPVRVDLRTDAGIERAYSVATRDGRHVIAAALNAGVGMGGRFVDTDLSDDLAVIDLNVRSTVRLAKLVVRGMADNGGGQVLFTSSTAAAMPGPNMAVYNASKSFVQSFAEAVREELRGSGVTVTALMPGPTRTNFFRRAGMEETLLGRMPKDDPARTAMQAVDALLAGKRKVVTASLASKTMSLLNRVLPDSLKAKSNRLLAARPGSVDGRH